MKIACIGVGQAGGKIVDALVAYDETQRVNFVVDSIAVNTARADLAGLKRIPEEKRVLVGQTRVKGHGVGADNELGAEVAMEDVDELMRAVDAARAHEIDAFLVVAGLGGGTGSGGAPVFARELRRRYEEPVYGLGVLPGRDEGGIYALNAARSFKTFVDEVDNLLVFDNDAWRATGESLAAGFNSLNHEIAVRLGTLFSAGETGGAAVAESVVDASEIINTLATGGVSTIGYATAEVSSSGRGVLSRFGGGGDRRPDDGAAQNRLVSCVRRATLGQLTLPCDVTSAERGLVVATGPSAELSRRGIERARKWVETETGTMEVRGGDYPLSRADEVAGLVLLSGVTDVPRIKELQAIAVETQEATRERAAQSKDALSALVGGRGDELEALF